MKRLIILQKYKLPIICLVIVFIFNVVGCSVAVRKNRADDFNETFRSNDIPVALDIIKTTSNEKNVLTNLELGQLYRFHNDKLIVDSNSNFLAADRYLDRWQTTFEDRLKKNLVEVSSYVISENFDSNYHFKNYEMSLLSQYIALNHLVEGRWDYALVEANKMAQREKYIEAIIQEKIDAIEIANQNKEIGVDFKKTDTTIESINGYPVNLVSNNEVNALKNSYQNASAYYLSAFIYESQKEISLAAPGYRLAFELLPQIKLFKEGLANLDLNVRNGIDEKISDTLFIIESGFLPKMEAKKFSKFFYVGSSLKSFTMSYPVIPRLTEGFKPSALQIDKKNINIEVVTNLDALARRELKDNLPGYITRATTRAITRLGIQVFASTAVRQNSNNPNVNAAVGIVGIILSDVMANGLQALDVVDTRHWQSLPAFISVARSQSSSGMNKLQFLLPNGSLHTENVMLQGGYNVV